MEKGYNYESEDSIKYSVKAKTKDSKLRIRFKCEIEGEQFYFYSIYRLQFLKDRFGKILKLEKIRQFLNIIKDNIKRKKLVIKPIYKNIVKSIWKTFPNDTTKEDSFTLVSTKYVNKNLSLIFFSNYERAQEVVNEIEKQGQLIIKSKTNQEIIYYNGFVLQNSLFIEEANLGKEEKMKKLYEIFEKNKKEKKKEFRTILVFFDEPNLEDIIIDVSKKLYKEQIFIIIIYSKIISELESELKFRINKFTDTRKSYFDMNNIYILSKNDYDHIYIPLLKIYNYFNQLGDGYYKEVADSNYEIKGFEEEFKYINNTHNFNIILCGLTGSGKSTFINTIMGEKKAFTLSGQSSGTYRNNYYIHKKYPIKIIDVCGFADGTEGKTNTEQLDYIYKKDNKNLIIDEYINDVFSFYGDKRNNIHLLLYFNIYNNKYDVLPGELNFIKYVKDLKIKIIFVVNKCDDKIFSQEEEKEELQELIEEARKNTFYKDCPTVFLNCIKKKGFDELLQLIFDNYKKNIVLDKDLYNLQKNLIKKETLGTIFKDSIFFGNIKPDDILLNDSLLTSVIDIKTLIVKLAGYYENKLRVSSSISFFFSRLYNSMNQDDNSNSFPLLTNLVQKIYKNFGFHKTKEECNNFIKKYIKEYFRLAPIKEEQNDDDKGGLRNEFSKYNFYRDLYILGNLFWNSDLNYKIDETIEKDWLVEDDNIDEDKDKKNNKNNNDDKKEKENNEKELKEKIFHVNEDDEEDDIEKEKLLSYVKKNFGLIKEEVELTPKQKMKIKLFYISYIANELINNICISLNKKGFEYKSICDFYYNVSSSYNKAIEGFIEIKNRIISENEELENYSKLKKEGIGNAPSTVIFGKNK